MTSTTTATITMFDQLSAEEKFLLLIITSSACARRGMTKAPARTKLTWNASGASTDILRDPDATSALLWNKLKKLPN
jgi:hypothetical protein